MQQLGLFDHLEDRTQSALPGGASALARTERLLLRGHRRRGRARPVDAELDDAALERVSRDAEKLSSTDDAAGEAERLGAQPALRGFKVEVFEDDLRHDASYRACLFSRRSRSRRANALTDPWVSLGGSDEPSSGASAGRVA